MGDAGAVQVQAADDQPEVMQRPERAGVAEDDQVEQAVVAPGRRGERQAQGVSGQVEDEGRRADQVSSRPSARSAVIVSAGNR